MLAATMVKEITVPSLFPYVLVGLTIVLVVWGVYALGFLMGRDYQRSQDGSRQNPG